MATGAAAAAVAGTAITIHGMREEAKAQAAAARRNAEAKRDAALAILEQQEIEEQNIVTEGAQVGAEQQTVMAGRGIDVSTGAALSIIEETNARVANSVLLSQKEAMAKVAKLNAGASIDEQLAKDIKKTSRIRMLGALVRGGGHTATTLK